MDEFMSWKKEEKVPSLTMSYIMVRSKHLQQGIINRLGFYKEKGHGIRNMNCQNSSKIGSTCTSHKC